VVDLARAAPIYSMRAMLQLVASVYAKMPSAQFDCSKMLFDLCGNVPWIYGFAVVRTGGRVTCATGAIDSRVAAGRRASPTARAADDRYRSFQAIERPLRSRQGRCVPACLRACVPACLRAVGETLSPVTLEKAVVVARYGGEELAFLLPGSMSGARPRSPKRRAGPSKTFS
jgi:hypothetical protein